MHSPSALLAKLKQAGHRTTAARTALLEVLTASGRPHSVPELLKALAKRKLHVNKTTLYRELTFLVGEGIVHDVRLGERQTRYEIADDGHHHHLVCTECDAVEDVELEHDLDLVEKRIAKQNKFSITRHTLEFFGVCRSCQTA